ncbi:hypothetical protein B194_4499 [Serratia plymuthica A30]|uniref:Uncharacterized protein n=1 Tax=Serratia plymuthica S13 TaxID=1348660 RepID=S4YR73_SERPL|nr:hypothetical protein M621_21410 [Serratia plymuthica S13]EKF62621.1 hypothetical protein B194_4499 [Serratia plymuthica A30]
MLKKFSVVKSSAMSANKNKESDFLFYPNPAKTTFFGGLSTV